MNKRISWIDIAKAIAIFLVAFGHTLRGGAGHQAVYAFHVPAFFFLAGMTYRRETPIGTQLKKDARSLLIPYAVFGLISILIYALLGKVAGAALDVNGEVPFADNLLGLLYANARTGAMRFNLPLWFLPALFVGKLVYALFVRIGKGKDGAILLLTVGFAALAFGYSRLDLPALPFSFEITLKLLPFFAIGNILMRIPRFLALDEKKRSIHLLLAVVLLGAAVSVGISSAPVDYCSDSFENPLTFYVAALLGSFGVAALARAVGHSRLLELLGKRSLAVLVMHKFPIVFFQVFGPFKAPLAAYDSPVGILSALAVSMISALLCIAVSEVILRVCPILLGSRKNPRT